MEVNNVNHQEENIQVPLPAPHELQEIDDSIQEIITEEQQSDFSVFISTVKYPSNCKGTSHTNLEYSRMLNTQESGCASGTDHFRT